MNTTQNFYYSTVLLAIIFLCGLSLGLATELMLFCIGLILIRFVVISKAKEVKDGKN